MAAVPEVVGCCSMALLVARPTSATPPLVAAYLLVGLEDDDDGGSGVARRWPDAGLDCGTFVRRVEDGGGSQGRHADGFSGCARESQSAWSVRRPRLLADGTLDVAMWPGLVDVDWLF
ncbi:MULTISPECIES: hypothetical protein [unclassified Aeromicrobium]|uniref:hypothetical protein n=1 Tax=unclassified Aeromicrobium TaxID=2633570 RepID=UPI00257BBC53|nr:MULTISPECIES: hypothetical protein [unclassified Aeromicrobium]